MAEKEFFAVVFACKKIRSYIYYWLES
jgi:hypothetical protein